MTHSWLLAAFTASLLVGNASLWASEGIEIRADLDTVSRSITYGPGGLVRLGAALAAGDVDGDGVDDLLIGAPKAAGGCGEAYLIYGASTETCDLQEDVALTLPEDADAIFRGLSPDGLCSGSDASGGEEAGRAVILSDIDGDHRADVVLGAPYASTQSDGSFDGALRIWVSGILGLNERWSGLYEAQSASLNIEGEAGSKGQLGAFLTQAGDVDGDGTVDLLVGAPQYEEAGVDLGGRLYLLSAAALPTSVPSADNAVQVNSIMSWAIQGESRRASMGSAGVIMRSPTGQLLLAAGSPGNRAGTAPPYEECRGGMLFLYDVTALGESSVLSPTPETPAPATYCSTESNASLGLVLAHTSDRDGAHRLYVSAKRAMGGQGRVYVLDPLAAVNGSGTFDYVESTNSNSLLATITPPSETCPEAASPQFGTSMLVLDPTDNEDVGLTDDGCCRIAPVHDLDGDGWSDPVFSAATRCHMDEAQSVVGAGWAAIHGSQLGVNDQHARMELSLGYPGHLGTTLAQGDLDGDGQLELIIGAPGPETQEVDNKEAVYVISPYAFVDGDDDGYIPHPDPLDIGGLLGGDCCDGDELSHPGQEEVCDGKDNDCDGEVDEGTTVTYYIDSDRDGHGDSETRTEGCEVPLDAVTSAGDCDDNNKAVAPGGIEVCDTLDNDCDQAVDEGVQVLSYIDEDSDGYGRNASAEIACVIESGHTDTPGDCDDTDDNIYPDAPEVCDEKDGDCDDRVDEGVSFVWYRDTDGDAHGDGLESVRRCDQPAGYEPIGDDCDDSNVAIYPGASEVCDHADNDCDGLVDDADESLDMETAVDWYLDRDGDCYGDSMVDPIRACTQPTPLPDLDFDEPESVCDGAPVKSRPFVREGDDCNDEPGIGLLFNPGIEVTPGDDVEDRNCDRDNRRGCGFADESRPVADESGCLSCTTSHGGAIVLYLVCGRRRRRKSAAHIDTHRAE